MMKSQFLGKLSKVSIPVRGKGIKTREQIKLAYLKDEVSIPVRGKGIKTRSFWIRDDLPV